MCLKGYYNYTKLSRHIDRNTGFDSGEGKCLTIVHYKQRARSSPRTTVLFSVSMYVHVIFTS